MICRCIGVLPLVSISFVGACGTDSDPTLDPSPSVVINSNSGGWARGAAFVRVSFAPIEIVDEVRLTVDGVPSGTFDPTTLQPGYDASEKLLPWDTTQVADGAHHIVVDATTATGRSASDDVTAQVDNTAPVITLVSGQNATEAPFDLQFAVADNGSGVLQAYVQPVTGGGGFAIDTTTWRASISGCVDGAFRAEVVDRVGNSASIDLNLNAIDTCDRDCDGARSVGTCGGNDCNDAVDSIPSFTDSFGDLIDENCDGVDGTDVDGDGVPGSSTTAAPDCNDNAPSVHGYWSGWSPLATIGAERRDGIEATIAMRGNAAAVLYPVMTGSSTNTALDIARRDAAGTWSPSTRLADGVTGARAAIQFDSSGNLHVSFTLSTANGPTVVHATDATGTMVSETVTNGTFLGMTIDDAGAVQLLFRNPSPYSTRHARQTATGWNFLTLAQPTSNAPGSVFTQGGVVTYASSDTTGLRIDRFVGGQWTVERVASVATYLHDAVPLGSDIILAASESAPGTIHILGGPFGASPGTTFAASPFGTLRLSAGSDGRLHLVTDPSVGLVGLHRVYSGGVWYEEPTPAMGRITTDAAGRAHALGNVFSRTMPGAAAPFGEGTPKLPAADSVGDGVDQDCDGVDG
ncbi:MAG TPA: hypothetical protein VM261_31615 [Kofleriaceae bacterium]|nr:hypothetical protein [Kofleriaceae bacterium]